MSRLIKLIKIRYPNKIPTPKSKTPGKVFTYASREITPTPPINKTIETARRGKKNFPSLKFALKPPSAFTFAITFLVKKIINPKARGITAGHKGKRASTSPV